MSARNLQSALDVYDGFNRRDFDAATQAVAETCVWTDHARGITVKTREEFRDILEDWAGAFADGQITDIRAWDAGNTIVVQFVGRGTNDGAMGNMPATGRRVAVPFCDVIRFDDRGQIVAGETYFDLYGMLVQLGHVEPPAP